MGFPFPIPYDPNQPIPNNPFYYPETNYMVTGLGPLVIGAGFSTNYATSTISATGGGGVTDISAGFGISVSPPSGTGSVVITNTGVRSLTAAGGITLSSSTGDITISATGGSGVTSVTASLPLLSSGGATPDISLQTSGVLAGPYTNADITVDAYGRVTAAANGATVGPATPTTRGTVFGLTSNSDLNVALGDSALASITSGDRNTSIGAYAGGQITTGDWNTGIGQAAIGIATSGCSNTALGVFSLGGVTIGDRNIGIGVDAGVSIDTGCDNIVFGYSAGSNLTSGCNNVIIGPSLQVPSNTGSCQLALGFAAGQCWLSGNSTKAIRPGAGIIDCTGSCGTLDQVLSSTGSNAIAWTTLAIPTSAIPTSEGIVFACTTAGISALGLGNLTSNTGGNALVAVGGSALNSAAASVGSTAVGENSLSLATDSIDDVAIGVSALPAAVVSCFNVAVGGYAGDGFSSGCCNVFIGYCVAPSAANVNDELAIGNPGGAWLRGNSTYAIAPGAGIIDCTGSCGTNGQALLSNGANAVIWGNPSAAAATPTVLGTLLGCTLVNNTALGCNALLAVPTGIFNTGVGASALVALGAGCFNVGLGGFAVACNVSGCHNVGLGVNAARNALGSNNTVVGHNALFNATGGCNTVLGFQAGCSITTGGFNVVIGPEAQVASPTGSCQLAIGFSLTNNWLTGDSTKAIRPGAGIIDCAGTTGTNGQVLMSNGSNAICWAAVPAATPIALGTVYGCTVTTGPFFNTSLGLCANRNNGGAFVTAIGHQALAALTSGTNNTAVGHQAACALTGGICNVAVGALAGRAITTGIGLTAVGQIALCATTGSNNTGVGNNVGNLLTSGANNTLLGSCAGCNLTTGSNNVAIGFNTTVASAAGSCQLAIGFSATDNWLTGTSTKAIKPGAGIIDCANSCGAAGQVLTSNGSNAVCWTTLPANGFIWQELTPTTTTSTAATTILTLPIATVRGVTVNVSVSNPTTGNFHNDGWMVTQDGTTAAAQLASPGAHIGPSPYSLSATVSGTDLLVQVTSAAASSTKYVGVYQTFAV